MSETIPTFFSKEELLKFINSETTRLISIEHIKEFLSMPLAHLHAILFKHRDYFLQLELP